MLRIRGSICATRLGVNARAVGERRRVCAGGSRLTIDGCGLCPPASRICVTSGTSCTRGSCADAAEYVSSSRKTSSRETPARGGRNQRETGQGARSSFGIVSPLSLAPGICRLTTLRFSGARHGAASAPPQRLRVPCQRFELAGFELQSAFYGPFGSSEVVAQPHPELDVTE